MTNSRQKLKDFEIDYLPFRVDNWLTFHMLNVGQGDCLLLNLPKEGNKKFLIVIDHYGNVERTELYIRDYLNVSESDDIIFIISHAHDDHIENMIDFLKKFTPKRLYISPLIRIFYPKYFAIINTAFKLNIPVKILQPPMKLEYANVKIECIGPNHLNPNILDPNNIISKKIFTNPQSIIGFKNRTEVIFKPLKIKWEKNQEKIVDLKLLIEKIQELIKNDPERSIDVISDTELQILIEKLKDLINIVFDPTELKIEEEIRNFNITLSTEDMKKIKIAFQSMKIDTLSSDFDQYINLILDYINLIKEKFQEIISIREFERKKENIKEIYKIIQLILIEIEKSNKEMIRIESIYNSLKLLSSIKNEEVSPNDSSIVLKIIYAKCSILLTGDAQKKIWSSISGIENIDILKVPHHGGEGADEKTLKRINPNFAAISVGVNPDNTYGHPTSKVINTLKSISRIRLDTDESFNRFRIYRTDDLMHTAKYNELELFKDIQLGAEVKNDIISYVFGIIPRIPIDSGKGRINVYRLYAKLKKSFILKDPFIDYESFIDSNTKADVQKGKI